jgi:hypothetical protein
MESTNGQQTYPKTDKPLVRLCALDTLFNATGTVEVKVGSHTQIIPIQSVDAEEVQAIMGKPPRAPMFIHRVNNENQRVRDLANPQYTDELEVYTRTQMLVWICCAIAVDIVLKSGTLVWSADNSVRDIAGAKQALKEMGLVDNQLVTIFRAAQQLTEQAQEVRALE